jgi:DNA-binding XRE family transcriptional regulator
MARKIGILPNTWIDWEKGRHKPNTEARRKLEEYIASLKQQGIIISSLEEFSNL